MDLPTIYRPNAAVIVTDGAGRVLLCHRAEQTYQKVQTVQGGIDAGESAAVAAARELKEELGLTDGQFSMIGALPTPYKYDWPLDYIRAKGMGRYRGQEQWFFLAQVAPDTSFVLDAHHREFSLVEWGTPQALIDQSWEGKRPGIEAALRHFGLL